MNNQKVKIEEGKISFWIKEKMLQFDDNKLTPLIQLNPSEGSIFILKDDDNKLKFFHVYIGRGRTDVEHDVSSLNPSKRHMIAVTWNVKDKEIIMYINGEKVARTEINY